ncbi:MAG: zinc-ribbon domain-containing protein [Rhodanobacteraceae bacterium]|nr:zinc-ribbon domain-containing protein [Rhodanobacteraceae bacterium]
MNATYTAPQRWTMSADEIASALAGLGLRPTAASPLPAAPAAASTPSDPPLALALRILAAPSASLRQRHGGPWRDYALASACRQGGQDAIAAALTRADGRMDLLLYADARSYVDDWLDAHASAADDDLPNLLPPPLPLRALPLLLHAIDAYRRASYASALAYANAAPLHLAVDEFTASLGAASASTDLRWLLPAFLQLTPGLDLAALVPDEADLGLLADCELLTLAPASAQFGFGEAGAALGSEFMLGWQHAVGLEWVRHSGSGDQTLARWFLAPTHLSNHCFELAADGNVNHQPLRVSVLALRLDQWLATPDAAPAAAPHCPHCGADIGPQARFCGSCGQALVSP